MTTTEPGAPLEPSLCSVISLPREGVHSPGSLGAPSQAGQGLEHPGTVELPPPRAIRGIGWFLRSLQPKPFQDSLRVPGTLCCLEWAAKHQLSGNLWSKNPELLGAVPKVGPGEVKLLSLQAIQWFLFHLGGFICIYFHDKLLFPSRHWSLSPLSSPHTSLPVLAVLSQAFLLQSVLRFLPCCSFSGHWSPQTRSGYFPTLIARISLYFAAVQSLALPK